MSPSGNAGKSDAATMDKSQLDRTALFGAAWMGAAKWSTQLISWLATIVVARILTPEDYGIVAMATVYLGLLSLLSEFGIGTTILTRRDVGDPELRQLNTVSALLGLACFAFSAALAWPLASFFQSDVLPAVVIVMSSTFAINALQIVPSATLRRELRFRTLALIDIVRGALVPAVTLILALLGADYWALVGGALASSAASAGLTLLNRRHGFSLPSWTGLFDKLQMSYRIVVSRLAWYIYSSADLVVAGRRLGEGPLGEYSLATTVATMPSNKIVALLTDVTPALFAAVQNSQEALRRYFLNMTELLAFVSFPVAVGLSLVSFDLVSVLLGEKWSGVAPVLMLLSAYSVVRALTPLFGHLFLAVGQAQFSMWTAIAAAVLLPIGFVVGSYWGIVGIAASWLAVHPLLTAVTFVRVRRILALTTAEYFRALRLGLDGSLVMLVTVLAVRAWLSLDSELLRLSADIAVGAATFALSTWVLHRKRLATIYEWFQKTRRSS